MKRIVRCAWVPVDNVLYEKYHDEEWGRPARDDQTQFEFLVLESAQAGLSWLTVLKKRENYRRAFKNFNYKIDAVLNSWAPRFAMLICRPPVWLMIIPWIVSDMWITSKTARKDYSKII